MPTSSEADLHFYFDPVCPFAWMTSKWVRLVQAAKDYRVEWKLISLRLVNEQVDYDAMFPPEYEAGHNAGLRMLRVAAAARASLGPQATDRLQLAYGKQVFDRPKWANTEERLAVTGNEPMVTAALQDAGLSLEFLDALHDSSWDEEIRQETKQARALTGKDVGTPILHVDPPHGVAFFGPVISREPAAADAVELWDHVLGLARYAGFAELKRSLRERPQLEVFGLDASTIGKVEDWHGGSRRQRVQ
jgi:predicted DsbA family dithiol-disulfide isomerase